MSIKEVFRYYPHNRKVFHALAERCKSGYAVPYIGAGLSVFAGMPTWWSLLNKLRQKCPDKAFSLANPLHAANEIEKQLGGLFLDFIKQEFHHSENNDWWLKLLSEQGAQSQAISDIPMLFHGPIITSNYDKLLEAVHQFNIDVALPDDIQELKDTNQEVRHLIYKVHGCISRPDSIIFTGHSYDRYYDINSEHVHILSSFFKRFNLVFLGCSLALSEGKDRPIELWETLVNSGQNHFAILPCEKQQCRKRYEELRRINIFPIFYPPSRHECVKLILDQLLLEKNGLYVVPEYDNTKNPFVGRNSFLKEIHDKLSNDNNGNVLYLTGTAGIGKTRLACEFAIREKHAYTSGIYIFHAVSKENLHAEVIQFAFSKGIITNDMEGGDNKAILSKMSQWMRRNDHWLFILDNVEHFEHIRDILGMYSGKSPYGHRHFLITTRNQNPPGARIRIRPFTKEESESLFAAITREKPDSYSGRLSKYMGGLPLAVEQAASYILKSQITYQECVSQIQSSDLLNVIGKGAHSDGTLAVRATYNLSMERIRHNETKQLMYLLSFFAPDNIDSNWILNSHDCLSDFPRLQSEVKDPVHLQRMMEELASYSLIQNRSGKVSVHRITQAVVRSSVPDGKWAILCCKVMAKAFDIENFDTSSSRSEFLRRVPHMEQMFRYCDEKTAMVDPFSLGMLYHLYMYGFDQIKEHKEALRYLNRTVRIRRGASDLRGLGKTYNLVGTVYQNLGEHETSLRYLLKALSVRKKAFKESSETEDEILIARSYNNIALYYFWRHLYEKAVKYCKLSLIIKEKYMDKEKGRNDAAFTFNNLGASYEMMSQYNNFQALLYNRKGYDIRKTGDNLVRTAFALNNLGVVEKNIGNFRDALIYFNKALELRETVYKTDPYHPEIAETCLNLGEILTCIGEYEKAKGYIDRALIIYEKRLTRKHFLTTIAYSTLAAWHYAQNQLDDALKWFETAWRIRKSILREDDRYIAESARMAVRCRMQLEGGSILD